MKKLIVLFFLVVSVKGFTQINKAGAWADSVLKTLSGDEKIAQLMVVRLSEKTATGFNYFDKKVAELVKQYNIGGVCLFQGGPQLQANTVNHLQAIAKTPILMCIDGEWGLGMRFDSVLPLPRQMMLGAMQDGNILYNYGKIVGEQCKRAGIQVNYAPVVDVNNNPNNPVINDRSFGEDKYKVATFGIQYMKGMQDAGTMACAKHFPGHGDVAVDSHYDLPVINKTMSELDSLELYPFREIFKAGIGSVMIAHLAIPAIDNTPNKPTSISYKNVTELMRNQLGYQGLTFTDALGMQGVNKYYPNGEASVQSLIAGNDMLCLPGDVPQAIEKIKEAIKSKLLSWSAIEAHCRKVLIAKFQYGLSALQPINLQNIVEDLNNKVPGMRRIVAENAITLLKKTDEEFFPLRMPENDNKSEIAYVCVGTSKENAFAKRMKMEYNAKVFYFDYKQDSTKILPAVELIKKEYKQVVIGVHDYLRVPSNNFGISRSAVEFVSQLQRQTTSITFVFGNPYAIKNWCSAKNLVACYEDDDIVQNTALDLLQGKITAKGRLPVTVCEGYKFGSGILSSGFFFAPGKSNQFIPDPVKLNAIDSLAKDAIANNATPGCVILVAKEGKIIYHKAFGNYTYANADPVKPESVFDMASVTKICATTISIMKLYDEGKIDLKKGLGDYLPWVKGTNKETLPVEKILLHQAGLVSYIPFYKEVIDSAGNPKPSVFSIKQKDSFNIKVAEALFMRNDWKDTLYQRILKSPLGEMDKYVYSDNDFIFLGKIVEAVSGLPLDEYVRKEFYSPLSLSATGFKPLNNIPISRVVPTENEKIFRQQLLRGNVHDPGAAMFGGVAGHAGLFSNAYDLAIIMQMLLNGGIFNDKRYLKKETVDVFTGYQSNISRRGYGFDKPEKDNATRLNPYPTLSVSSFAFGHTGFTGTCAWADPAHNLVYIFLSNRVHPNGADNKLLNMNVRPNINEVIYKAMGL